MQVELGEDVVLDGTLIPRLRHLLERRDLSETLFADIGVLLDAGDAHRPVDRAARGDVHLRGPYGERGYGARR